MINFNLAFNCIKRYSNAIYWSLFALFVVFLFFAIFQLHLDKRSNFPVVDGYVYDNLYYKCQFGTMYSLGRVDTLMVDSRNNPVKCTNKVMSKREFMDL